MKNIYEILKDYGLEIPEEKKADFDKSWKENYRTKNEYDKAVNQRDEYKTSLDTVNEKLKEFDGVDVADLKGQITKLQDDLKTQKETYDAKEAERLFTDSVKSAIKEAGGRNAKAVMALLDMDALRESKDQSADIKKHWMLQKSLTLICLEQMNLSRIRSDRPAETAARTRHLLP